MLLFLRNPTLSLHHTIKLIESFSRLSQYSISWSKSSILPLHDNSWDVAAVTPPVPLSTDHITYLGIKISPRLSELFTLNFPPLRKQIQDDLQRWMNLPISIAGRISVIKMSILPKVNYLFSMTPVQPTYSWLKSLDSTINKFYWKNKPPHIKLKTLQKPKALGGLNAPNFYHYSIASHLQFIHNWIHPNETNTIWTDIEQ